MVKSWRLVILSLLLLTGVLRPPAHGQTGIVVNRQLPFAAALQVADQVIEAVNSKGSIPENYPLLYSDGRTEQISAVQALGLLAAAGESLRQGKTSLLPLFPPETGAPTVSAGAALPGDGALFSTASVLNQAQGALNFTLAIGAFPSAIWIGEERIASGDYLVALATILRFAAEKLELPSQVMIISYRPPSAWIIKPKAKPAAAIPPVKPPAPSPAAAPIAAAPLPSPTLEIFPKEGAKLQGKVSVVVTISPAATYADVTFCVDGRPLMHSNWPPFVLYLDTAQLTQGEHKIRVEAVDVEGKPLASREVKVLVEAKAPGASEDSGETAGDED